MITKQITAISTCLLMSMAAVASEPPVTLESLIELKASSRTASPLKLSSRDKVIVQIAKTVGLSAGFEDYRREISAALDRHSDTLDKVYYFPYVMVRTDTGALILPPVVEEYGAEVTLLENGNALLERDARLVISKPARLIAGNHTWRSYFNFPRNQINRGDERGWPKNDRERALWSETLTKAWARGRKKAQSLFDQRFSDLEADYIGMLRYLEYVDRGMISTIYVAKNDRGVKVSSNGREMEIGGRFVRITRHASFDGTVKSWKPISIPIDWDDS
ncbi:MAG: type IV secretory system conjugative DNA transfer family protein [Kordiimonadaceae bacterium]|nr:type IV secretory system conjugative DNA transfer family protein [Kordiimonadaceae bacterium]